MNLKVERVGDSLPISILKIQGELDGSNYSEVINVAQELYRVGTRRLIIDLGETAYMSSSGLVALHVIAMQMLGEGATNQESGWESFRSIDRQASKGRHMNVKLLRPQPRVMRSLEMAGYPEFFEIYANIPDALLSFGVGKPDSSVTEPAVNR